MAFKDPDNTYGLAREIASDRAKDILADALVWDMTLPYGKSFISDQLLYRYKRSGHDLVSLTVNDFPGSVDGTVQTTALVYQQLNRLSDDFVLALTADDILAAKAQGKMALIFNHQETNQLERSAEMVEVYYRLGVRHMLLAYNMKNSAGDGCAEQTDAGLSRFGVEVIKEMNRVGMLVDGTHCGYRTTMEAMEVSEAPFIFSHSNAYALCDHYRNIKDDQIQACAATGGVIGINGCGFFMNDLLGKPETMFGHIDYMAELIGPQHIGLALDYLEDGPSFFASQRQQPLLWPPVNGKPHLEADYILPEEVVTLIDMMLARGYTEPVVRGILGENFLRVARQVWK